MKSGILLGTLALVLGSFAASSDDDKIPAIPAGGKLILYGPPRFEDGEKIAFAEIWNPNTPNSTIIHPLFPWSPDLAAPSHTLLPDGTILICGGASNNYRIKKNRISSGSFRIASARCDVMDPATLTSTHATPLPEPRNNHAAVVLGDSVFLCGGSYQGRGRHGAEKYRIGLRKMNDCFRYRDGAWKIIASLTTPRSTGSVLVSNGSALFACGGQFGVEPTTCESYDPAGDTWTAIPLPEKLDSLSAAFGADGRLYIVGNQWIPSQWTGKQWIRATPDPARVLIYDPASGTWSRGPELGRNLSPPFTAVNVDGALWVFGGHTELQVLEAGAQEWRPVRIPSFRTTAFESAIYLPPTTLGREDEVSEYSAPSTSPPSTFKPPPGKLVLYEGSMALKQGVELKFAEIWTPTMPNSTILYDQFRHSYGRDKASHTLLPDGFVLTCGGVFDRSHPFHSFKPSVLCDVTDPAAGVFIPPKEPTPLPEPRYSHAAVALGDSVFLCGGQGLEKETRRSRLGTRDDCLRYQDGVWKRIAPMTEPRTTFTLLSNGSSVFACGGQDDGGVTTCESYNPARDIWTSIPIPEKLESLSAAFRADGRLYIVGEGARTKWTRGPTRVLVYDPASGTWSRGPELSRKHMSPPFTVVSVDGAIWVFGRIDYMALLVLEPCAQEWRQVQIPLSEPEKLPSFQIKAITSAIYIPPAPGDEEATEFPTSTSPCPPPAETTGRLPPASLSSDDEATVDEATITPSGKLFLYGGSTYLRESKEYEYFMEIWTSSSTTTLPLRMQDHDKYASYTFIDGNVLVCGGTKEKWHLVGGGGGWISYTPYANCDVMDPATGTSTPTTPLPEPRYHHAAVALGDSVLLCGGSSELNMTEDSPNRPGTRKDCLRFKDGVWEKAAPMTKPRETFALVSNGSFVFACGGQLKVPRHQPRPTSTTCDIYDPASDTWTASIQLPVKLRNLAAALGADGRLYMVGEGPATTPGYIGPARVVILDPATGSWSQGPELIKVNLSSYTAVNVDGAIWVFGRDRRPDTMTLQVLEPGAQKWRLQEKLTSLQTWHIKSAIYRPPQV